MAEISMKHIYKTYPGGVTAVHDFNLEVGNTEFIVLVGPSGCGKSTTLRMIAGLEEISEGELYIGGRLVNDVQPKDRDIAMVFQNYALYPHMTVFKNMAFGLQLRKVPKKEIAKRVEEAAKVLDIEHLLNRKPKQLSGGQRQRVALGRAMVRDTHVFLLDEPLSNLDAKLRASMRTEISKLHQRLGTTFVYVTHDQTEAMTMGDRIVVMKDGVIQQADVPQTLYNAPRNQFVAGFIGSPQMNFIPAVLEAENESLYASFHGSKCTIPAGKAEGSNLGRYVGREVTLGIRPECLYDGAASQGSDFGVMPAHVDVVEMMGAEKYLYATSCGQPIVARVPVHNGAAVGDAINLYVDCNRIHLFDRETGEAICC